MDKNKEHSRCIQDDNHCCSECPVELKWSVERLGTAVVVATNSLETFAYLSVSGDFRSITSKVAFAKSVAEKLNKKD